MTKNIFCRYTFITKIPYNETYKYKDVFQVIPHELTLNNDYSIRNNHCLNAIEINLNKFYELLNPEIDINKIFLDYKKLENKTIDLSQAYPVILKDHYTSLPNWIILNVLSVFTNFNHFDYSDQISEGWYKKIPFKRKKLEFGKKWLPENGNRISSFTIAINESIELIESSKYSKQICESGEKIYYPIDITERLNNFFKLQEEERSCYLTSIVLFKQALSNHTKFGSMSLVSLVSSIENLVFFTYRNTKIQKCECCQQERYKVTKKFNDFVKLYSEGFYTKKVIKEMIGDIYARRSSIVHKGMLFPHENSSSSFSKEKYFDSEIVIMEIGCASLTRYILNKWLKDQSA